MRSSAILGGAISNRKLQETQLFRDFFFDKSRISPQTAAKIIRWLRMTMWSAKSVTSWELRGSAVILEMLGQVLPTPHRDPRVTTPL